MFTAGPHELRQKLINLLYLVFITLAFIYLPSDFVDSSKYIEKSFIQSAKEYESNIESQKNLLDEHLYLNSPLAQDYYNVMEISKAIDTSVQHIDRVLLIVQENVGGYNKNGYLNKSKNFLISNGLIVNNGLVTTLKEQVEGIKQKIKAYNLSPIVPGLDSILPESIGIVSSSGKSRTWEQFFFGKTPITIINTNLNKIKSDLLYTKYKLVNYLLNNLSNNKSSKSVSILSSNSITLEVLATQNFVLGDRVAFKVVLRDPSKNYKRVKSYLKKNNKIIKQIDILDSGVASFVANETGNYQVVVEDGSDTIVQNIVINNLRSAFAEKTDLEVMYMGIDNPIHLQTTVLKVEDLETEVDNGEVIPFEGSLYLRFPTEGVAHLKVYAKNSDGRYLVSEKSYLVKKLPSPEVMMDGRKGGDIPEKILHIQDKLTAGNSLINADVYDLLSYELVKVSNRGKESVVNRGNSFSHEARVMVKSIKSGDFLIIDNIKIRATDGTLKDVAPAVFRVN